MPADFREAFKSPFHSSNPTSRLHDVDTFTKDELRKEFHQANVPQTNLELRNTYSPIQPNTKYVNDFNTNYRINKDARLPDYAPSVQYPTLHPLGEMKHDEDETIVKDPHHGAGWIKIPREPSYLENNTETHSASPNNETNMPENDMSRKLCDELIQKVLTNSYCRRILRKILIEENTIPSIEGFIGSLNHFNIDIKSIIIYFLGGLLLLFLIEIIIKSRG